MRALVTGASGFVGSLLVPRLLADGHEVRALGRDPERVRRALDRTLARGTQRGALDRTRAQGEQRGEDVEVLGGDALGGAGLAAALERVDVAYYLIHSMEPMRSVHDERGAFAERDRIAAENFAAAAARAGVGRIVYLGGIVPSWERDDAVHPPSSLHLSSRADVERILLAAVPGSLALRASIVIGAGSRSFRLLVHLVERMPVLTLPAWRRFRTQPIDARDAIDMLAAAATARPPKPSLDVGGPHALSYEEMLTRIAELMLVSRPTVGLRVNLTGLTGRLAAAIGGEDPELVLPLMEGLRGDVLPADDRAAELLGVRLHSFDAAVEHALGEWEEHEPLAAR